MLSIYFFPFFFQVSFMHLDRDIVISVNNYVITNKPCISITHDNDSTWSLKIHNITKEDEGYYRCQLNSNPLLFTVGFLDVVGM